MQNSTDHPAADPNRARVDSARKGAAIESGAARTRAVRSRASRRRSKSAVLTDFSGVDPREREAMIAESAYFRSAHRGFEPGHEVDDWLAAESEVDAALALGELSQTAARRDSDAA